MNTTLMIPLLEIKAQKAKAELLRAMDDIYDPPAALRLSPSGGASLAAERAAGYGSGKRAGRKARKPHNGGHAA